MVWVRWFVIVLAVFQAGFMAFDGAHALILGDYVTPKVGRFAGQLGPWASVLRSAGIEPRSVPVRLVFVAYGAAWLTIAYQFARGRRWGRAAMLAAVIGSLWWVGAQTVLAVAQILILILLPSNRPPEPPAA